MNAFVLHVHKALRKAGRPLTVQQLADAIEGEGAVEHRRIKAAAGILQTQNLVRVVRDGVHGDLLYVALGGILDGAPEPEPSMRETVLAELDDVPRSRGEIASKTGLSPLQVSTCLSRLFALGEAKAMKRNGWVARPRGDDPAAAPAPIASRAADTTPSAAAMDALVDAAQAALDAYVASRVDDDIYAALRNALTAARHARRCLLSTTYHDQVSP